MIAAAPAGHAASFDVFERTILEKRLFMPGREQTFRRNAVSIDSDEYRAMVASQNTIISAPRS